MTAHPSDTTENGIVRYLKRKWLAILLVLLLIVVAIQNGVGDDQATIFVLWAQLTIPTWVLVVVVFLIGGIVGWVFARNRAARRDRR
jgi:putative membrane protein